MNYYDHHIGDYDEATAHLTACEDGIYSRMIRKYYATEKPLISDIPKLQRLLRAKTREEKNAVLSVLEEFFHLEEDGWHQDRCDSAIEKFIASEPEREVKKANEDNRTKRHREERASLFKQLTDAGHHAAWNIGITELRSFVERVCGTPETPNSNAPVTQPVTAPATPVTATQTPVPNTHLPIPNTQEVNLKAKDSDDSTVPDLDPPRVAPLPMRETPPLSDDPAIQLNVKLRRLGVNSLFTHPAVQDWTTKGVSIEILTQAVAVARESKGNGKIPPGYLVPIVNDLLNPPAAAEPGQRQYGGPKRYDGPHQSGVKRAPSGNDPKGLDESYADYDARIAKVEAERRKGQP